MVVGIDSGKSGAMAVILPSGEVWFYDWHDRVYQDLLRVRDWPLAIGLEVQSPSQSRATGNDPVTGAPVSVAREGVTSVFTNGRVYGEWRGALCALDLDYRLIQPKEWQKGLVPPGIPKKSRKKLIAEAMAKLYPKAKKQLYGPRGGLMDGRSDALAIAHYVKRTT